MNYKHKARIARHKKTKSVDVNNDDAIIIFALAINLPLLIVVAWYMLFYDCFPYPSFWLTSYLLKWCPGV